MLFNYKAIDSAGSEKSGSIEAINVDVAINGLQRRGLIISEIKSADESDSIFSKSFGFHHISNKDIVILAGQQVPLYTRIVIGMSSFVVNYGIFLLIALIILGFFGGYYVRGPRGKEALARTKLEIPYVGTLYRKLYLSRISDNMNTL